MNTDSVHAAVLITMPHSHYSEKARWALDRLELPYREQPHVPLLHRLATVPNGGSSVPLLLHRGARFTDSTDILVHIDLLHGGDCLYPRDVDSRPEVEALETQFDEVLGPHTRRWAYAQLLPERSLLLHVMSRGVPRFEAALLPVILPGVVRLIRATLRITPDSATRSIERVRSVFDEIDGRLADGRRFLVGERFTAADLTFAALAAPVLFPSGYRAAYPALDHVPAAMRDEALRLRDTAAGQFALRLYLEERDRTHTTPQERRCGAE
ncbi:glutathione S-transferase family protein [Burkholderia sp. BCC1972]|uniref:glutathione S-transferase family protein n=1 Tax=Burkholderia sp. BCC1972 TaxID=2817438 RepID=UPI002ABDED6D|nr:glutathione S-transferase family protein [Burkholderia sp. BCC1972]